MNRYAKGVIAVAMSIAAICGVVVTNVPATPQWIVIGAAIANAVGVVLKRNYPYP